MNPPLNPANNTSNNKGGASRNRGNFDSVPADDGFRSYMSRKIELQRKQFGLVLPPPPPPSPPLSPPALPPAALEKSNVIYDSTATNTLLRTEKKSVRFHDNIEVEGVSQLLSNLKQKYTGKIQSSRLSSAHKRRRLRQVDNPRLNSDGEESSVLDEHVHNTAFLPTDGYSSVLGVLNNLQRRHGTSSITRKRLHEESSPDTQEFGQCSDNQELSALESLKSDEKDNPVSSASAGRLGDGGNNSDVQYKTRRQSPRCLGSSVLELLEPGASMHGESIADAFHSQQSHSDQFAEHSKSRHSPVSSEPIYNSQATPPRETAATSTNFLPTKSTNLGKKPNHRPDLFFSGVVVLVNGHTSPDATTLMRLLHKHGGDLEKYETRRVTHIIAEQLSAAKAKIYKQQRKPTPICRPQWIVDSVERGMLLPFGDYLLENVLNDDVVGIKSFFSMNLECSNETAPAESGGRNAESHKLQSSREDVRSVAFADEPKTHRWQDTHPSQANYHVNGQVRTVGNDPNFLESYFKNSRLSYIGSFKQRVKPTKQTCRSRAKEDSTMFVLLVDMDYFFAAVSLKKFPQYRDNPIAVGHSHVARSQQTESRTANSSSELSTCNYIARKCGVRKGMFLGDAIKLCPDLIVLPYDFEGYEEISGKVATLLERVAEEFNGCIEQVSCDESYVEINVTQNDCDGKDIYDFVHNLAEHIRADIVKETECTASIGIGPNKMLAKLAADRVKPDASFVVKHWREFLSDRDLRDIPGIGRKLEKKLKIHGLSTINDVWDLEDDAVNVLGDVLGHGHAQKIVQFCYGKDDRPVTPVLRKSISAECNYGVRFDGPYGIDYMMKGLASEVTKRMTDAHCRGTKLTLKVMKCRDPSKVPGKFLGHGLCDSFSRSIDIPLTRDNEVVYAAAMKLHEKLGIDALSTRGMGIVISALKSDNENLDVAPSSPSMLSSWLRKDTSSVPSVLESPEGQKSPRGTFAVVDTEELLSPTIYYSADSSGSTNPTFSQLDQDVLRSLPDDILSEVRIMYGKSSREQSMSGNTKSSPKSPKSKHLGKVCAKDKPIPIVGQASVRRMLKLACIKSGAENLVGNRLSQLECLPLEVQLQIANADDIQITKRTKQHASAADQRIASVEMIHAYHPQFDETEVTSVGDDFRGFYHDNIGPLRGFISSNPNPDSMTVETVRDFLLLCVQEKRIHDAVIFLRTVKHMRVTGWSKEIYLHLRKSTLEHIHSTTGSVLDLEWLGL